MARIFYIFHLLLVFLYPVVDSTRTTKNLKSICGTENWTTVNLKVIQDVDDIKRITSDKCAVILQNAPSGKLTKTIVNLLSKQSLKILQINGKVNSMDDESLTSLRALKHLHLSDVDLGNSEVATGTGGFTKNLETLDLSKNELHNLSFFKTESKKMKKMMLDTNKIQTVPKELKVFENLEELSMKRNKIRNISLDYTMIDVERLDLSHNFISNLSGLYHFPNLVVCDLRNNLINDLRDEYFEQERTELRELLLDYNSIGALPIRILFNLPKLKSFSITRNELRTLIATTEHYRNTALEYIDMGDNVLDEIPHSFMKWFPSLKKLKINNNKLAYIRTGTFANLNKLEVLDLSNNAFVNFEVKRLIPLESLRSLNISNNKIEVIDYFSLTLDIPSLKSIKIDGNSLFCENLVAMLNFFDNNGIYVDKSECEGKEHIRGICCVDSTKNYTDNKIDLASYALMTHNLDYSKKLLEMLKNITEERNSVSSEQNNAVFITKATFWTGLGVIIIVLISILLVLIFGLILKKKDILPVHL